MTLGTAINCLEDAKQFYSNGGPNQEAIQWVIEKFGRKKMGYRKCTHCGLEMCGEWTRCLRCGARDDKLQPYDPDLSDVLLL